MSDLFEPSTDDPNGLNATKSPFPQPGVGVMKRWYLDKAPRGYRPFIVEVTAKAANSLTFYLLDKTSGQRAHTTSITGNPNDATRIYNDIPSTAQDADPSDDNRKCGFLFLTQAYLDELISSGTINTQTRTSAEGSSKWPKGAAALASGINRLLEQAKANDVFLSKDERYAIQVLLSEIS